jgi:excisionase family DNA binding protein
MHPSGLDPARQGTSKEDASGSISGEYASRLIEPLPRTDALQPLPLNEGGNPTLPDEGDTMMTDSQLLLSVEEAAELLRLGRTRTYELVMTRKIQSVKVGRRRLVVRSSLVDFVQTLLVEQDWA